MIFRKLLRRGYFSGYSGQLYLWKAILQGGFSELCFIQLFCFVTALMFSCVQMNRELIKVVFSTVEFESYLELIIYPIRLTVDHATHSCFLKPVRF